MEIENKTSSKKDYDDNQLNFENISQTIAIEKLKKTNIDEMNDTELREFMKEVMKYL